MRVLELAKKYKLGKNEFLEIIDRNVGIKGKKTTSGLSEAEVKRIEEYIGNKVREKLSAQKAKTEALKKTEAGSEKKAAPAKKAAKKEKPVKKAGKKETKEKKETKKKKAKKTLPAKKTPKKAPAKKPEKKKPAPASAKGKPSAPPEEAKPVKVPEAKPVPAAAVISEEKPAVEIKEKKPAVKPEPAKKTVLLEGSENIKQFSEKTNIPSAEIIKYFFLQGLAFNVNQPPGRENLEKACEVFGFTPEFSREEVPAVKKIPEEEEGTLLPRPPVVTIMGHVDHGKTTILDTIRKSRIAEKEHGQITQKIGAYKLDSKKGSIVFFDTPGHESFTAMRARGTLVTDIVILVVAADEGVKPQTVEAINHARSANVPIIVAVNKIDKPNINPDKIKKQLAEYQLVPEEWGGDTVFVNVSGVTGQGIDELLEMIILMGEMLELKATPEGCAKGVVVESFIDRSKGPIVNVLIRKGTLKSGDPFIAGDVRGRVRAIIDDWGRKIDSAGPSTPVEILGAGGVAIPGEKFNTVKSDKIARQISEERRESSGSRKEQVVKKVTLQDLYDEIQKGEVKELKLIVKTDYAGTIDAIKDVIGKIPSNEVKISVIHSETGAVSESDVLLASASNAVVVGFNVPLNQKVEDIAQSEGVEVRTYKIIYELAEDIKKAVEGMLEPEEQEILSGQAVVKKVFRLSDKSSIAGCLVVDGKIVRNSLGKVVRGGSVVFTGTISSLKRFKESAKEVKQNTECGIGMDNFTDFYEGDIIQSYVKTTVAKKL
ncbi:MAG: translation initiation factor IF-2 [Candidatus Omnitrophica bacterium]|nr:translation initiation factor IF-2 [Candidatus Omnitrophota bacterium]